MPETLGAHLHISALNFVIFLLYLILAHAFLRVVAALLHDTKAGKALAFVC